MKLRNLLFGTMIACVFAACSNEDDPIPSVRFFAQHGKFCKKDWYFCGF